MLFLQITLLCLLLLWLFAMISAYGYGTLGRRLRSMESVVAATEPLPPLSVVIPAHNAAARLRHQLTTILEQDYERFEVIVVDMGSTDDTKDVLERLEQKYAHLTHTFTPQSARDISLDRLALTLGIRAASYEWVVITHSDCVPLSSGWLTRIGETIVHPKRSPQSPYLSTPDLVLGIARYEDGHASWLERKASFMRLWNNIAAVNHVLSGHAAVSCEACNIAIRKAFFLEKGGFMLGQDLKAGAEELLVNQDSTLHNTALLLVPAGTVVQQRLHHPGQWQKLRLFYAETRRHQRHTTLFRLKRWLRLSLPWLMLLTLVPVVLTRSFIALGVYALLLFIYGCFKIYHFNLTASQLGCHSYYLTLWLFELWLPIWDLKAWLNHRMASKNQFRKKFV